MTINSNFKLKRKDFMSESDKSCFLQTNVSLVQITQPELPITKLLFSSLIEMHNTVKRIKKLRIFS